MIIVRAPYITFQGASLFYDILPIVPLFNHAIYNIIRSNDIKYVF